MKYDDFVKLTVILQLSDPSEYEGGYVDIMTDGITRIERTKGSLYVIPAYTPHMVTPVTAGIRMTMAAWFVGPKFK